MTEAAYCVMSTRGRRLLAQGALGARQNNRRTTQLGVRRLEGQDPSYIMMSVALVMMTT